MTPQEKANELIGKFKDYCFHNFDNDAEEQKINNAKECALITTEYLMKQLDNMGQSIVHAERNFRMNYWEQVRGEIKKQIVNCDACGKEYKEPSPSETFGQFNICPECKERTDLEME